MDVADAPDVPEMPDVPDTGAPTKPWNTAAYSPVKYADFVALSERVGMLERAVANLATKRRATDEEDGS